ncbi:CRE-PAT-6 protein [Caenorhabditis remanei]|uniref:CRE-PAT-6 protein n=2 Tax=Caenorhabditis remanei TaxID=31234 RepID=E3NES6_CAERE|nr:CRE-PAT-6 protein [Caenorhabditis remanei]
MSTLGRSKTPSRDDSKKPSVFEKLSGTLSRKKKLPEEEQNGQGGGQHGGAEEDEVLELELEGREALDSSLVPVLARNIWLEEGETRRYLTKETARDQKLAQVVDLLIYWLNEELADQRIVVRHIQEDLFDGQIIQKLLEKLEQIRIEVPEVSQSEEGQRQKLQIVIQTVNRILGQPRDQEKWSADLIHQKDFTAIIQLLVLIALHYRAPVRFPDNVVANVVVAQKEHGQVKTHRITEQITTVQTELAPKGTRDAFDTLFDYGPDKLAHVKTSLLAFCNKHLNKINLEVSDLDTQFQDGVFLVLLVGLLEGYFVPLYHFNLQVHGHEEKVKNVSFAFKLMEDAGLEKPRSRVQDIANGDVKSTLRLLHLLFTKYKHI